jgi:hypothetical protein
MTFFDLMVDLEYFWKDTTDSWPSSIFGFGLGTVENPPPVNVDTEALYRSITTGFDRYGEVWKKILPKSEFEKFARTVEIPQDEFYYHSDFWARILFNYAIAYRNNEIPKNVIVESMIPFYHSRILSFVNKTVDLDTKECEEYFERIMRVFEEEKPYLIKRWDEDQKKLGHKLFKF